MKKLVLIIAFIGMVSITYGQQTHTIKFENLPGNYVEIMLGGKVTIKGHSKNEIIIESPDYKPTENKGMEENAEIPDRAKGLKSLNQEMYEHSILGLSIETGAKSVEIQDLFNRGNYTYNITLPDKVRVKFTRMDNNEKHDIKISDLLGEVNVEVINSNLSLSMVSGPIVATTVNGNMEVTYGNLNASKPNSFTSINGFLDISMANNVNADVAISTINGQAFTDFELNSKSAGGPPSPMGNEGEEMFTLAGKINNGGTRINISTVNGDIYLRKK